MFAQEQERPSPPAPAALVAGQGSDKHAAESEILVQFKASATEAEITDAMAKGKLRVKRNIHTSAMKARGHRGVARAESDLPLERAIAELKKHSAVEFAEPNWTYTHQVASNDPYYTGGYLWGVCGDLTLPSTPWGSQAAEAWQAGYTGSNTVYVGIIDEGIQYTHPDLSPNMWNNPFDPPDGIDNDGNGYIDDVYGWNFYNGSAAIFDSSGDMHGTHVAGTIGAKGGNGLGVAGVNWNVTIISGKFLGPQGGSTADAVEAIDYFVDLKVRHKINLVALNNSWGGGGYSQALHDAILRAAKANILFVAAAGNGNASGTGLNNDLVPQYPANYDTRVGTSTESAAGYNAVIAVAAIDYNGARATFSNYGATKVHLGAPGVSILSTVPTDGVGYASGTSMATPHVTGAAALYASSHPGASADQIRTALLGAAKATASLTGITTTGGRLDLSTVIGSVTPPTPNPGLPSVPSNLFAQAAKAQVNGNSAVTLTWTPSPGAGSYVVKRATSAAGPFVRVASGVSSAGYTEAVVADGSEYDYVVSAVNTVGESANSPAAVVKPVNPAPTKLTATALSRTEIRLSWIDNSADAAGFRVAYSADGINWYYLGAVGANVTTANAYGLYPNRTYYFAVRAYNGSAQTAYSNIASARTYY